MPRKVAWGLVVVGFIAWFVGMEAYEAPSSSGMHDAATACVGFGLGIAYSGWLLHAYLDTLGQ